MQKTMASFQHKELIFKSAAKTSRDTLKTKDTYIIELWNHLNPTVVGAGECSPIWGLSVESKPELEEKLKEVCASPDYYLANMSLLDSFPAIRFGLEMAQMDLNAGGKAIIYPSPFTSGTKGIPINGLIWMGEFDSMYSQIEQKIKEGWKCIKIKIGSLNFEEEYKMISSIRENFSKNDIELRVDANGAFSVKEASEKLEKLATLDLHSIEQPIAVNQWLQMSELCKTSPIAIALDEELIGMQDLESKIEMLELIQPQYLIFKPSLIGGFKKTKEWIQLCNERKIDWWITSALESNIGLNAIAQFTYEMKAKGYQGLGTGMLYENNFNSPLSIHSGELFHS